MVNLYILGSGLSSCGLTYKQFELLIEKESCFRVRLPGKFGEMRDVMFDMAEVFEGK